MLSAFRWACLTRRRVRAGRSPGMLPSRRTGDTAARASDHKPIVLEAGSCRSTAGRCGRHKSTCSRASESCRVGIPIGVGCVQGGRLWTCERIEAVGPILQSRCRGGSKQLFGGWGSYNACPGRYSTQGRPCRLNSGLNPCPLVVGQLGGLGGGRTRARIGFNSSTPSTRLGRNRSNGAIDSSTPSTSSSTRSTGDSGRWGWRGAS